MATQKREFKAKYSISSVIQQLQRMCLGTLFVTEDGKISFVLFNPSGTVQRTLTDEDIFDVNVETTYGNLVNKISFTLANDTAHYQGNWSMNDSASQTNFTPPSGSSYVAEATVDFSLIKSRFYPSDLITSTSAVDITLLDGDVLSLCGTRGCDNPGSQPADAKISTSRPLYLRIENEIIKETDALTINASGQKSIPFVVDENGKVSATAGTGYYANATLESSGMTRAALSTTATVHPSSGNNLTGTSEEWQQFIAEEPIQDLTIPERWGRLQLARFSNGCPILSFKTSIRHADLQIGDMIYITHQLYAMYQDTSSDSNTIWEIINKELDVNTGVIFWKVARVTRSSITAVSSAYNFLGGPGSRTTVGALSAAMDSMRAGQHHIAGMQLAAATGLTFTIDKGTVFVGAKSYRYPVKITYSVDASKDTYVYVDKRTGSVSMISTANGAGYPSNDHNLIPLGIVISNGSAVTDVTYIANLSPATSSQTGLNTRLTDNFILNGDFGGWAVGNLRPPDKWKFFTRASELTTDPFLEAAGTWGAIMTRVRTPVITGSYAAQYALGPLDGGAAYTYLVQTEMVPIRAEAPYILAGECTDDNYGTNGVELYGVMFEYDADKNFLGRTSPSITNGIIDGTFTGKPFSVEINPTYSDTRWARFGFFFSSDSEGTGTTFTMDNINGYIPAPSIERYRGTAQSVNSATWTTIQYNSLYIDGYWSSFWNSGSYYFTAPISGTYQISAYVTITSLGNNKLVKLRLADSGGSSLKPMTQVYNTTGAGTDTIASASITYQCVAGQTMLVQVYHDHGSARDVAADSSISIDYVPLKSITI